MKLFSKMSPIESVAMKYRHWNWFSNPYNNLNDEELLELLFHMETTSIHKSHFAAACKKAQNLFLRDVPELLYMKRDTVGVEIRSPYKFKSGSVYHGEWLGNKRHGFGRQYWTDGCYYEGWWQNNCAHGTGRFVFATLQGKENSDDAVKRTSSEATDDVTKKLDELKDRDGNEYFGEWKMSMAWGLGRFVARDGGHNYAGQWERDQKSGYGIETLDYGAVYMGEFRNSTRHGPGVLVLADGTRFSGRWQLGRLSGCGRIHGPHGSSLYEGEFLDGMRHGVGRLIIGRTIYQGEFDSDVKCGFGEYVWPDGRAYLGSWKDDSMHGAGTLLQGNGGAKLDCALRYGQVIALSAHPTGAN